MGARARALDARPRRGGGEVLWQRCCNRRTGSSRPIPEAELARLARRGAPLDTRVVAGDALAELGAALGALDRVRFLSPRLRRDLIGELRFTPEEAQASRDGIDVASLELDGADLAAMDVLRTGAGMDFLARLDRGRGLATPPRDAFAASAGAIVLRAAAVDRAALLDAGRGLMRLWLEATRRGLAIHPWGSPFLFQRLLEDGDSLEGWERSALTHAADGFERRRRARPRPPGPAHPARLAGRPAVGAVAAAAGRRRARLRGVRLSTPRGTG